MESALRVLLLSARIPWILIVAGNFPRWKLSRPSLRPSLSSPRDAVSLVIQSRNLSRNRGAMQNYNLPPPPEQSRESLSLRGWQILPPPLLIPGLPDCLPAA